MNHIGQNADKRNLIHIELLRIIAIWLVMFNHTSTRGFTLFTVEQESALFPLYLFFSIADKVAVPVFYMISGALLLGKDESIKEVFTKRILKYGVILFVISACYQIYNWLFNDGSLRILSLFKTIYCYGASSALWYLYSYLSVLVMLPLLRRMVRGMEKTEYIYMAAFHFLLIGIIPTIEYRLSAGTIHMTGSVSLPLITAANIFYFVMGYFFERILPENYFNRKNVLTGCALSIAAICVCCYMTVYKMNLTGEYTDGAVQTFHNTLIMIPTFTLYFSVKALFLKVQFKNAALKIIKTLGGCTFGIFLLEGMLRQRTRFVYDRLQPSVGAMPACFIWITVCFFAGFAITWLLKKIPVIKKYL